jgi:tRNA(Ile)-lysidine synthase
VVAVSGGLDSMVLLHALHRLKRKFPWDLTVAHAHHGLRGADADADAEWVRSQAAVLGLPCVVEPLPVRSAAKASRESLEMAARRLRHAFLARTALGLGTSEVVLAHHAQDQAELILLRLLRGAGSEGLGGMRECSPSPADRRVTLLRPFLGFDRAELERFARDHGIVHREDASNRDLSIPRNRIRHQLIPDWMAHHSPALPRVLNRIADIASQEADYLRQQALKWRTSDHPDPWESLHVALQRAILRSELLEQGRSAEFEAVERLRRARASRPTEQASAPSISKSMRKNRRPPTPSVTVSFQGSKGECPLPDGARLQWKRLKRPLPFGQGWEQFDATTLPESVALRHRLPGDRFQPLGQSSPARLQNLFINRRIPATERDRRWVLELGEGILGWVEGFPAGDPHRLGPSTREILALRIDRQDGLLEPAAGSALGLPCPSARVATPERSP